jgi:hypothetical protein
MPHAGRGKGKALMEFHTAKAFARDEPRVELIEAMLKSVLQVVELEFEGKPVKVDGFRLRDLESWRTANETSLQDNIGSLSTACNCRCSFCFEAGNPPGLFEKRPTFVSLQEAETRRRYLRDGKGLLRESKGYYEPLMNPDFLSILSLIREHNPEHVIDLTSNGALLTPDVVSRLAELKPVYVDISLISADDATRFSVMGDHRGGAARRAVELLRSNDIPFMGTVVPWPEQGLDDVARAVEYLDAYEACVIRVSVPGISRHHPKYQPGVIEAWIPRVVEQALELRARLKSLIIVSPHAHVSTSMDPIIEGVVAASPARAAGVRLGDRILSIDGKQVVSKAHAASLLKRGAEKGAADVELLRDGTTYLVRLEEPGKDENAYPYKPRGYPPLRIPGLTFGLCLPGSFHLQYLKQIHDAIECRGAKHALVAASHFYHDLVGHMLARLPLPNGSALSVVAVPTQFFGGTVTLGDLWVLDDVYDAVKPHLRGPERPDLLVLPNSFLSRWGRDLRGVSYRELEARLDLEIALVDCERIMM